MGIVTGYLSQLVSSGIKLLVGGTAVSSSNPLPVAQTDGLAVSGTATSAAVLFTTSMLNYESITVQVTSAGTGCTITYETSDDNTNWVSIGGLNANAVGTLTTSTTSTAATMIQFSRKGLYFRARVSTYGSGTVTVIGTLSKVAVVNTLPAIYSVHTEGNTVSSGTFGITVEGRTSSKTSASNAQFVRPISTTDGRLVTRQNSIPENEWVYAAASGGITNTTTAATLVAAQAAGVRNYLTSLQLSSDVLGATTEIAIRDGAGGTVLWRGKIGTAGIAGVSTIQFSDPLKSTAATLLEVVTLTASVTGGVYVNAQGYIAP